MSEDLVTWLNVQLDEDERNLQAGLAEHLGTRPENDFRFRLAEVDAKRRILARHATELHHLQGAICLWCSLPQAGAYQSEPCPDKCDLALPYADRPGYRDEWRP